MKTVRYVPSDMDAPGCYRCLFPARQLKEQAGWNISMPPYTVKELENDRYRVVFEIEFELPTYADLYVLGQRKERIWSEVGIPKLRANGTATSIDVDDNYINLPPYNPAFLGTHQYRRDDGVIVNRKMRRNLKKNTKFVAPPNKSNAGHLHDALGKVDLVTVSTPHLGNVYESYSKNIKVIRNYLDWDVWEDIQPQYEVERERLRIGYLGLYRYRRGDLEVLGRTIQKFLKAHPEVDFVTNSEETHDFLGVPEEQRITIGEYNFQSYEDGKFTGDLPVGRMTAVCDVGLVPLVMNDLNQSKSHLKGMEYNAAGIPFIASPTESYTDYWIKEGKGSNGFIAYTEEDWYETMEVLIQNHDLRRQSGKAGRKVAQEHSIQNHWDEWYDAYQELLGDSHYATARRSISLGAVQKTSELGPFLMFVDKLKPRVVVEIGTARGGTFWAVSQYAADDALMISMDIPAGSPLDVSAGKDVYTGRDRDRIKHFVRAQQQLRLIDVNSQTQAAYAALLSVLGGQKIDLLFIDGDHRYEGVKHDYETYSKLVRPGGAVAFHDITHHLDERVGVERLWGEIQANSKQNQILEFVGKETWGYSPWGGIGVLHVE